MNPVVAYILARLGEASTYRGIFALLTALGLALKPEQAAAITSAGLALIGVVNVFKKDALVRLILLAPACLMLTSCESIKSFVVANESLIEETVVYGARAGVRAGVAKIKSSAKNPTNVTP